MLLASPGGIYQRFDSMAVDGAGNVNIATLLNGGITVISADGGRHHVPLPDRFTTNMCFRGKVVRSVYVTLSGSGRLIAINEWPCAALRSNYQLPA